MKRAVKMFGLSLTVLLIAGVVTLANAQRGYRDYYGRGSRDYARVYHGGYHAYRYSPPMVVRNFPPVVFGPRYYGVPHGSISITFGGNPYFYFGGTFYRHYGSYYRSVFPPMGIRIGILPFGCLPVYAGANLFYLYNGIYYRRYDDKSYEVVDAPIGAQLSALPSGAKSVVINGEKVL